MKVDDGYWRDSTNTTKLYKCKWGLCISNSSNYCREGYTGPLCEECSQSSQYFDSGSGSCKECNSKNLVVTMVFILLGICIVMALSFLLKTKMSNILNISSKLNLHVKLKIFVTFYQILSSLESVYNVKVDESLQNAMNFANILSFDLLRLSPFPLECISGKIGLYIINATWPFILCGGIGFLSVIGKRMLRYRNLNRTTVTQIIILVFYFTLPVVTQSLVSAALF